MDSFLGYWGVCRRKLSSMSIGQLNLESPMRTCSSRNYCAIMRQKREKGEYQKVIYLEPILLGQENNHLSLLPLGLLCVLLRKPISPLPDEVISRLLDAYRATGRQPRRNRTTGQYPIIEKCTRFINALYAKGGKGRLSQETLKQFGFSAHDQREFLKKVMVKARIIRVGHYRSKTMSRIYYLTNDTMQELDRQRKPQRGELAG